MKSFATRILMSACVTFTVIMAIWSIMGLVFAGPEYGIVITLTILAAAAALAVLRGIWFTDKLITRLAYPLRILGFGVTAFMALAACAWAGSWLPIDNASAWLTFTAIYLVILVAFCVGYQVHFKRTVGNFDAALRAYHERNDRTL